VSVSHQFFVTTGSLNSTPLLSKCRRIGDPCPIAHEDGSPSRPRSHIPRSVTLRTESRTQVASRRAGNRLLVSVTVSLRAGAAQLQPDAAICVEPEFESYTVATKLPLMFVSESHGVPPLLV
jgi:hypothetical protein